MIGGSKKTTQLHFLTKGITPLIQTELYQQLIRQADINIKQGFSSINRKNIARTNWYLASDHAIFYRAKIPFIYFGVGVHKNYHSPNDNFENINTTFYLSATTSIYQQLLYIDKHLP
jgi:hypothetical protein